jgi:hypothetical protein
MAERTDDGNRSALQYILAALLFIGGLLLLVVVINLRSQADDSSTSASISNQAPTVDELVVSDSSQGAAISALDLNENVNKSIYVYGSYTDNNGCADVTSLTLELYQLGSSVSGCTTNDLNCYNGSSTGYSCNWTSVPGDACSGGTDATANYECTVPIRYFADATDAGPFSTYNWAAKVVATDAASAFGTAIGNYEVNTLTALDVGTSINYGSLSLSSTSPADETLTITNTGNNDALNVLASGTNMTCTVGSIPVGNQHYASSSGQAYGSMTALSGSPANIGASINKATSIGTPSTYDTYWKLQVPSSGLAGSCSGTSTFSAT